MVSFSCDVCQNVLTKPKVQRHFMSCRTQTVSCIDCGVVFDERSVKPHTSCITEAEKYAPKGQAASTECTQTYCGICKLSLNGAVHALQHYESKKHRARDRKLKSSSSGKGEADKSAAKRPAIPDGGKPEKAEEFKEQGEGKGMKVIDNGRVQKKSGLKRAMKRALKSAPKQKLKRDALIKTIAKLLGEKAPKDLACQVDKKVRKSSSFKVRNDRISLIADADAKDD